jgi:hypothetical protein
VGVVDEDRGAGLLGRLDDPGSGAMSPSMLNTPSVTTRISR